MHTKRNIVIGQRVAADKAVQARRLRQQMTAEEKQLWRRLKGNRLGFHFRRQQVIDGFIVDFYCHAVGLVIEVDGEIHASQAEYDAERDHILRERGLHILRIPNAAIHADLEGVLERIGGCLADLTPLDLTP